MGNCVQGTGDNRDPDPTGTLYADVPVDDTFEHPAYCDYITEGRANCGSDEFVPAGNSETGCACRGLCNDGCRKKLCKRVAYKGDPVKCCITSKKTLGKGKTCNPKYRSYETNDCDAAMDKYCAMGSNLFNNPNCTSWFNQRTEAATATLEKVCDESENIAKPQCGCILARKEMLQKFASGSKVAVECIDNRCTNSGWKTYQMQQNPCNVVNCEMNITDLKLVANAPVGHYSASFVQECKNEKDKIETGKKIVPTTPTDTDRIKSLTSSGPFVGAIILIIVIVIALIIYYMMAEDEE